MKILVIGSEGFIGSNCSSYFSQKGYEVIRCDIYEKPGEAGYISLKEGISTINEIFSSSSFEFCINAAGSARVDYSFQFPEKDFELNVSLVINLLGAIKKKFPGCKFINFSSAAVYGNPSKLPIEESADTNPLSPYGYHKLLSENLLVEYHKFFGLKTCSLRVFSAFGEGLKKQLFWDLYEKLSRSADVTLFGTGRESRDFIYIKDLIRAVELIMEKAEFKGEIYNVANGDEMRIDEAVSVFIEEFGWQGKVNYSGDVKIGDPVNWQADIQRIRTLGYRQQFSFKDGIKNYCRWLKELK